MAQLLSNDIATSVLAWSTHASRSDSIGEEDLAAEVDEPPEHRQGDAIHTASFRRTSIPTVVDRRRSLLTSALRSPVEEDSPTPQPFSADQGCRRSFTSNMSVASTADLTSDTGISTPSRSETPSPRLPDHGLLPLLPDMDKDVDQNTLQIVGSVLARVSSDKPLLQNPSTTQRFLGDKSEQVPPKKRCITFACAANPRKQESEVGLVAVAAPAQLPSVVTPVPQQPRKTCIRFACTTRPVPAKVSALPGVEATVTSQTRCSQLSNDGSPVSVRKLRSSSTRSSRSVTPRRTPINPVPTFDKRYITADAKVLDSEPCRFHEFASAQMMDDDWIRQEKATDSSSRLTIEDTLRKENIIRQIGREAEEEAEDEEAAEEGADAEDVEEDEDEQTEVMDDQENLSGYGSDDDMTDGYNSDEEYGFDDSDTESTNDPLRTATDNLARLSLSRPYVVRGISFDPGYSDSSAYSIIQHRTRRSRPRMIGCARPTTPELPDSTDFVCGTFDEDRPLEAAYMSAVTLRRQDNLMPIPQDIDPSFPTSDPESGDDEEKAGASGGSIGHGLMHGEFEDIHHVVDRDERLKKKGQRQPHQSPVRRYHSPPPKRHISPAPKCRGRSPRRLFERASPQRIRSPAPTQLLVSPPASSTLRVRPGAFTLLAARPGPTHTKSLPKVPSYHPHAVKPATRRSRANTLTKDKHVRGAIDIVKGLEQKRQRRREKFLQKHCHRARKGHHNNEKRPQPGKGAERMRELGLIMAGKAGQGGNYVLSI